MVIFTPRPQRFRDNLPLPVGVFEDDALSGPARILGNLGRLAP